MREHRINSLGTEFYKTTAEETMNTMDAMPKWQRELIHEYGFKVVTQVLRAYQENTDAKTIESHCKILRRRYHFHAFPRVYDFLNGR